MWQRSPLGVGVTDGHVTSPPLVTSSLTFLLLINVSGIPPVFRLQTPVQVSSPNPVATSVKTLQSLSHKNKPLCGYFSYLLPVTSTLATQEASLFPSSY